MRSPASLAQATLSWLLHESGAASGSHEPLNTVPLAVVTKVQSLSHESLRAAIVGLLRAAAEENGADQSEWSIHVAEAVEQTESLVELDRLIYGALASAAVLGAMTPSERCAAIARGLRAWFDLVAPRHGAPRKLDEWIENGWLDWGVRGGRLTFYAAFCRALHPALRRDQDALESKHLDLTTWRLWLINESHPATSTEPATSPGRRMTSLAIAAGLAILAIVGASAWWKSMSPDTLDSAPDEKTAAPAPIAEKTVELKAGEPTEPLQAASNPAEETTAAASSPPEPRRPLEEGTDLVEAAEKAVARGETQEALTLMTRAQTTLDIVYPANDAALGDALAKIGRFWETQDNWAEAVRIHQKAVQAYEKTPAENTAPQLDAVHRWASALHHTGRDTEAERVYRTLLRAYETTGSLQLDVATVAHNLANLLSATRRQKEARLYYEKSLSLLASELPSNPLAQGLLPSMKRSYERCLRTLGLPDSRIEAEMRLILKEKAPLSGIPGASKSGQRDGYSLSVVTKK